MTRNELAAVATAIMLAASGAAFGAFLAVSQLEEQVHKYFGGKPVERDQTIRVIHHPDDMNTSSLVENFERIKDGAPWDL